MGTINLGMNFDDAGKAGSFSPIPVGVYTMQLSDAEIKQKDAMSRPRLNVRCTVIDNPEYNGRIVFHSIPLPWNDPKTGEFVQSWINNLHNIMLAVGSSWEGDSIEDDVLISAINGSVATANVSTKVKRAQNPVSGQWEDIADPTPNDYDNVIKSFIVA